MGQMIGTSIDENLGWEILTVSEGFSSDVFARDPLTSKVYRLCGIAPTTWMPIKTDNEIIEAFDRYFCLASVR
jgi:hypothetical protein